MGWLEDEVSWWHVPRSRDWHTVNLGACEDGSTLTWRLREVPHLLITGRTNRGKGSALRTILTHAVLHDFEVVLVNPKGAGEFKHFTDRLGIDELPARATKPGDFELIAKCLGEVEVELERRADVIQAAGADDWMKLTHDWRPILVVVDEATNLLRVKGKDPTTRYREGIGHMLTTLAQTGRFAGVHLVLVAQRPDVDALGPSGGMLRENCGGRILVGRMAPKSAAMVLDLADDDRAVVRGIPNIPGRCMAQGLTASQVDVAVAQLAWLSPTDLIGACP